MTLEEYIDRYGINLDELCSSLLQRVEYLDPNKKQVLFEVLNPEGKSAAQSNLLNLVSEAQENLALAKKLRESVVGVDGQILGTVGDVTKTLMAVDKCLDGASKRFSTIYSIHSMQALEDAVKEAMKEMDQPLYEKFIATMEGKLRAVR
jgi:hypothetical protein